MQPILVTTSCQSRADAEKIGSEALKKRLAACVQITGQVSSSYWWNAQIETDSEYLVNMKSTKNHFERLAELIRMVHPYEVPEIIAIDIVAIDPPYFDWLVKELAGERG